MRLAEPDDRLLVLRRLDLGRLEVRATSEYWASRAAERVGAQKARAVHGTAAGAASADAVWFHSFDEARTLLLTEVMAERMPAAWFWRLAVPTWHGARLVVWLPALVAESVAQPVIEASLARAMVTVAASGGGGLGFLAASLAACPRPRGHDVQPVGPLPPVARGMAEPANRMVTPEVRARAHRMLVRLDTLSRAEVLRILAALPASSPARLWIARLALIAVAPELASHAALLVATTEALIDVAMALGEPVRPGNDLAPASVRRPTAHDDASDLEPQGVTQPPQRDGVAHHADIPNVDTPLPPLDTPTAATTPTALTAPVLTEPVVTTVQPATERPSEAAGLFLLIRPLVMMGFLDWLDAHPDLAADGFGRALLHDVATRMRIAETDPVFAVLGWDTSGIPQPQNRVTPGENSPPPLVGLGTETDPARTPGHIIPNPASLTAWRVGLDRWLRRTAGRRLTDVVRRPGWLIDTGEHLSIRFRIDDADIRLRRRALDIDPGWVPWLGRVVRYHYRDEPQR